ncbi:hypothetical protein Dip518_000955 [Parelusimicrobium proximum]|uniref:epoxyqueuosine reductase QueH n=1 Tax=Parelusimicrobium proximum TaxID=3228953 RepID=UPI003D1780FD
MAKILLLSCCGPCSCAVIEHLAGEKADFEVLFYNPNIMPEAEYEKRKDENKRVCDKYGVKFTDLDYENEKWLSAVAGLEAEPERGERCRKCFEMRLKKAAEYAKERGFSCFTSVLGVSRYKNLDDVDKISKQISEETGVLYLDTNWRKGGLEELRRKLVKELDMYSQDYCGCIFSKRDLR